MEDSRSIGATLADLVNEVSTLLRTEASVVRAEMSENFSSFAGGVGMLIVGAALLIPGLVLLLQAMASAVTAAGVPNYWSLAIFGAAAFIGGLILTFIGRKRTMVSSLKPRRTLQDLNREVAMAKEKMSGSSQPAE